MFFSGQPKDLAFFQSGSISKGDLCVTLLSLYLPTVKAQLTALLKNLLCCNKELDKNFFRFSRVVTGDCIGNAPDFAWMQFSDANLKFNTSIQELTENTQFDSL